MTLAWLPLVVFATHVVEELPRFPAWATKHFGATSTAWYVYSHIGLAAFIVPVCALVASGDLTIRVLWVAIACSLACNALFHLVTTWLFREYSPGLMTGLVALIPGAIAVVDHAGLSYGQFAIATAVGVITQAAVIASLWLQLDLGWDLRRRDRPAS